MVQRTLEKIDNLKQRPHHERRAIAAYASYAVVGVLVLGWAFASLNSLTDQAESIAQASAAQSAQAASAAQAVVPEEQTVPTDLVASSTNGRVELVPKR